MFEPTDPSAIAARIKAEALSACGHAETRVNEYGAAYCTACGFYVDESMLWSELRLLLEEMEKPNTTEGYRTHRTRALGVCDQLARIRE